MTRNNPEHQIQVAFFQWCRHNEETYHELKRGIFAIPNGGHRHIQVARYMKAEGTRAGVLDVQLPCPRGKFIGLWIEFKYGSNKLTPEQREFAQLMTTWGHKVVVCYDWLEATLVVQEYLSLPAPKGRKQ